MTIKLARLVTQKTRLADRFWLKPHNISSKITFILYCIPFKTVRMMYIHAVKMCTWFASLEFCFFFFPFIEKLYLPVCSTVPASLQVRGRSSNYGLQMREKYFSKNYGISPWKVGIVGLEVNKVPTILCNNFQFVKFTSLN